MKAINFINIILSIYRYNYKQLVTPICHKPEITLHLNYRNLTILKPQRFHTVDKILTEKLDKNLRKELTKTLTNTKDKVNTLKHLPGIWTEKT